MGPMPMRELACCPRRNLPAAQEERRQVTAAYRERTDRAPPPRLRQQRALHLRCEAQGLFRIDDHLQGSICKAPDVGHQLMQQLKSFLIAHVGRVMRRLLHGPDSRSRKGKENKTRRARASSAECLQRAAICGRSSEKSDRTTRRWGPFPEMKVPPNTAAQAGSTSTVRAADCIAYSARRDQSSAISSRIVRSWSESMVRAISRHCAAN